MKIKSKFLILILFFGTVGQSIAQENCKVLLSAIAGKYEGECKKGNANGVGKAEGIDQYQGEFKDGLPHGTGTYSWKNGDSYVGKWSNGKRDGDGIMKIKKKDGADSLLTGVWKKDLYLGKTDKPFKVYARTLQVTRADIEYKMTDENAIILTLSNTTGNVPSLNGQIAIKATLGQIAISQGSYTRVLNVSETAKQLTYKLDNVIFPFRAKFRFGNQEIDALFSEKGVYTMNVVLNN
ncbi:MORN repeat-containing protein [Daejeonella lutea]|uniref:MORN repeat-containing protein n=1 Tax=Daejeonella lutea TaxID=572036 RepID=A0A1T5DQY6_9SPHI|nr:hypothetical protein [Daejeonella lutea]SKB73960.1 MORN repeat-containing protein [Daejeonella lutea]